jgi:hypothetical protein
LSPLTVWGLRRQLNEATHGWPMHPKSHLTNFHWYIGSYPINFTRTQCNNFLLIIKVEEADSEADSEAIPIHQLTFNKLEDCLQPGKVVGKFFFTLCKHFLIISI